jgi:hypothetical protein
MKKPIHTQPGAFGKCRHRNSHDLTQERDAISSKLKAEAKKRKAKQ